ncbi:hypothetical protein F2P81_021429 [Scophthalmus maximus]|uniref:Uncharacterized protein n=1 Tax=Scophthalmus maximus TaxID=52904 RepID=A0A6A4S5Z8_SCOMX|nr:hypothetical protein F2P81_021429 [Scophthalmus maximus]
MPPHVCVGRSVSTEDTAAPSKRVLVPKSGPELFRECSSTVLCIHHVRRSSPSLPTAKTSTNQRARAVLGTASSKGSLENEQLL